MWCCHCAGYGRNYLERNRICTRLVGAENNDGVDTANHIDAVASRRNEVFESLFGVQIAFKTPSRQSVEFQIRCESAFSARNWQKEILRSGAFS